MITYLINMSIALAGFLLLYYLLLQQETMYRFNRVYLLAAIFCSLIIPVLPLKKNIIEVPVVESTPNKDVQVKIVQMVELPENVSQDINDYTMNWSMILLCAYLAVSVSLLVRYIYNLISIRVLAKTNEQIDAGAIRYVLLDKDIIPFSFLRNVFVSKTLFAEGKIPEEILIHEEAHVVNKHSRDILLVEFLLCMLWFHPLMYLYRRAIKLNHEFEADSIVIQHTHNVWGYKKILLSNVLHASHVPIASSFNFFITKKRIAMMTKQSRSTSMLFKKILITPAFAAIVFFCSATVDKVVAQQKTKIVEVTMKDLGKTSTKEVILKKDTSKVKINEVTMQDISPQKIVEVTMSDLGPSTSDKTVGEIQNNDNNILTTLKDTTKQKGLSKEEMQEYQDIINSYNIKLNRETYSEFWRAIKTEDCIRLRTLYYAMSREQQLTQNVSFHKMEKFEKNVPEKSLFEKFKDSSKYEISIDGKDVANSELNKYESTDFETYKLFENSSGRKMPPYGRNVVMLITPNFFEFINRSLTTNNNPKNEMGFVEIKVSTKKVDSSSL